MPIILPGANPRACDLCDESLLYVAIYTISAFDAKAGPVRTVSMQIPVCGGHAEKISFEIVKELVVPKGLILL